MQRHAKQALDVPGMHGSLCWGGEGQRASVSAFAVGTDVQSTKEGMRDPRFFGLVDEVLKWPAARTDNYLATV